MRGNILKEAWERKDINNTRTEIVVPYISQISKQHEVTNSKTQNLFQNTRTPKRYKIIRQTWAEPPNIIGIDGY